MANKILKELLSPHLKSGTAIMFLFALGLLYFNVWAGLAAFALTAAFWFYAGRIYRRRTVAFEAYAESVARDMEETVRQFLFNNPQPLCLIDSSNSLLWFNDLFLGLYEDAEMIRSSIAEVAGLSYFDLLEQDAGSKPILLRRKDKVFRVFTSRPDKDKHKDGTLMLCFVDVSGFERLKTLYSEERSCYAYIHVDNYDELVASSPDDRKSVLSSQIEGIVRQWTSKIGGTMVKYKSGKFFVIFEQKHLERLEAGKFSILDEVRALETDADFPASLSIGVGVGGKTLPELESYGLAALDLALGRGGDQAVIKRKNKTEYYGGKLQTVEKRNKGKSRIMAHALRQLIDQSSRVLVMGHRNPDMDSFGAALGVARLVKNREKDAYVLVDSYGKPIRKLYEKARDSGQYKFVTADEARALADKDTLLVIVDTHRPGLLDCPDLLAVSEKLVVIDHHRKSEDSIDTATLSYMETYASSTSELIAEMFQYFGDGKKNIDRLEAEALLAGITVDTKSFSIKTGARTFEAASWLRRNGADTASVRQFFQTDMDFFKLKASIIADAEILPRGIAFSVCYGQHPNIQILTSQAADELLNIQDIRASFVAGSSETGQTVISARSLGEVNVQTVMEKMGGGGHLATAGAQLDKPLEEAIDDLKERIREIQ